MILTAETPGSPRINPGFGTGRLKPATCRDQQRHWLAGDHALKDMANRDKHAEARFDCL